MKNILISIMLCSFAFIGLAQHSFVLDGQIDGKSANGQIVKLQTLNGQKNFGKAVIKNNKFKIKGRIDDAELVRIVIAPDTNAKEDKWKASSFYIDRGNLSLSGHIDSIPTFHYVPNVPRIAPIVSGSQAQDLAYQLERSIAEDRKKVRQLNEEYEKEYYLPSLEGKFNTEKGITILKAITRYNERIFQTKWDFIKKSPHTIVSLESAMSLLGWYSEKDLNTVQIAELIEIFTPYWKNKSPYTEFLQEVSKAKSTAIGSKIPDGTIVDKEANKVQLKSIFPKDKKYVVIEFWASWCPPCRGEIPHLVQVMARWKDKGFDIVSIALDEDENEWKKAINEENMDWHQYNAREGYKSQIAQSYNIQSLPYALLIDSEGRVVRHRMYGANLDKALEELMN